MKEYSDGRGGSDGRGCIERGGHGETICDVVGEVGTVIISSKNGGKRDGKRTNIRFKYPASFTLALISFSSFTISNSEPFFLDRVFLVGVSNALDLPTGLIASTAPCECPL